MVNNKHNFYFYKYLSMIYKSKPFSRIVLQLKSVY